MRRLTDQSAPHLREDADPTEASYKLQLYSIYVSGFCVFDVIFSQEFIILPLDFIAPSILSKLWDGSL